MRIGASRLHPSDVLDEVEERRLGPVQVLEADDERAPARQRLERPANGPEDLLVDAAVSEDAVAAREQLRIASRCSCVAQGLSDDVRPPSVTEEVAEGPEGDPFSVGEAAADRGRRSVLDG